MTGNWKDWLPTKIKEWAQQYARLSNAGRFVKNADSTTSWHFDGWPIETVLARIRAEGEGASLRSAPSANTMHFQEVYRGNGLLIWRAIDGMWYDQRCVLYAKYLSRLTTRAQAQALCMDATKYWKLHDQAHVYISARIPLIEAAAKNAPASQPAFTE